MLYHYPNYLITISDSSVVSPCHPPTTFPLSALRKAAKIATKVLPWSAGRDFFSKFAHCSWEKIGKSSIIFLGGSVSRDLITHVLLNRRKASKSSFSPVKLRTNHHELLRLAMGDCGKIIKMLGKTVDRLDMVGL